MGKLTHVRSDKVFEAKTFQKKYDKNIRILILDPDETFLKFFKIHLTKFFSKVFVSKDSHNIKNLVFDKAIDLVIADKFYLNKRSNCLLQQLEQTRNIIPIILMKEHQRNHSDQNHNVDALLHKPFSIEELHDSIKLGLQKRGQIKELSQYVNDNEKHLQGLLSGKVKTEHVVEKKNLVEASNLLKAIQKKAA